MQIAITELQRVGDPLERYQRATAELERLELARNQLQLIRARACADMHRRHASYGTIAHVIGLTRSSAQQLVERGRPQLGEGRATG